VREPFDTSDLHSYDEGALAGIPAVGQQSLIIGGDCPANCQDRQHIQRQDLIEDSVATLCDVSSRRLGFGCGNRDEFDTLEGERGLDNNAYYGEKAPRVSFFQIGDDSSGVAPEAEAAT
jgi:hypothetical protein